MGDSLELLGDLLDLNGHFPQSQTAFEQALTFIDNPDGLRHARIYQKICETLVPQYRHPEAHAALDLAEQAIARSQESENRAQRQAWIQVQLARCQLFYWENETGRLDALLQSITPIVEGEGTTEQYLDLLRAQVEARLRHERYRVSDETLNLSKHRLDLAQTSADAFGQALAQFQYGFCLLWHGDFEASDEWLSKGRDGMARIGSRLWELRAALIETPMPPRSTRSASAGAGASQITSCEVMKKKRKTVTDTQLVAACLANGRARLDRMNDNGTWYDAQLALEKLNNLSIRAAEERGAKQ